MTAEKWQQELILWQKHSLHICSHTEKVCSNDVSNSVLKWPLGAQVQGQTVRFQQRLVAMWCQAPIVFRALRGVGGDSF